MPERVDGLPLDIIRSQARAYLAARGESRSNLYLNPAIYYEGETIQPDRAGTIIPRNSVIVFSDDEPLKNWGHPCRYLLHDPETGSLTGQIEALLPPTLHFGEEFIAFHTPSLFESSELLQWPIVEIPPWLFPEEAFQWHAILYSGASMNRHVNDLEFLYRTLVNVYRVPPANVTVLNYDGTLWYNDAQWTRDPGPIGNWPGDNTPYQMQIDGAGTRADLLDAIAKVGSRLGPEGRLLLHTNNHGDTVNGVSTIISYQGPDTTPNDLSDAVNGIPTFSCLIVMMEQCFSGGFIQPIMNASPARCTSVATAVDANTESAGGANFDPFALDWIEAMAATLPDGSALLPPAAPGPPTARQAFDYALATDVGTGDDPQFQSNLCGGGCTLAEPRWPFLVPPWWRYLHPWDILPDPSPEAIAQLRVDVDGLVRSGDLSKVVSDRFDSARASVTDAVRDGLYQ